MTAPKEGVLMCFFPAYAAGDQTILADTVGMTKIHTEVDRYNAITVYHDLRQESGSTGNKQMEYSTPALASSLQLVLTNV